MYTFNFWLFARIPSVLWIKTGEFCQSVGHHIGWYSRAVNKYGDIGIVDLLNICNTYRLPIAYFFLREGETLQNVEPIRSYLPAKLDGAVLIDIAAGHEGNAHVSDMKVNELFGRHRWGSIPWMADPTKMTAKQLVDACNLLKLDINRILIDPMKMLPSLYTKEEHEEVVAQLQPVAYGRWMPKKKGRGKSTKLAEENERLKREIEALRRENAQLKKDGYTHIGIAAEENAYNRE